MRNLSRFQAPPSAPVITPEAREVLQRRCSIPERCILTEWGQVRRALGAFAGG